MHSDFIKRLSAGGFGYYWAKPSAGPGKTTWFDGTIPEPPGGAVNVYFGVNPSRNRKGEDERALLTDLAGINCLYAEFDAKDYGSKLAANKHINSLALPPNVLIDSGGGYHAYWLLRSTAKITGPLDLDHLKEVQARWVAFVGGDMGAKDLARVLRVPGTKNYKYNPPRPVTLLYADYDLAYDLDDLTRALPAIQEPTPERPAPQQYTSNDAGQYWLSQAVRTAREGRRNDTGFWLACQLRDSGLSLPDAESIMLAYAGQVRSGKDIYHDTEARASLKSAYNAPAREAAKSKTSAAIKTNGNGHSQAEQPKEQPVNYLLTEPQDHYGHARCVLQKFPGRYLYVNQWGWLNYNNLYWVMDGAESQVNRSIIDTLKARRIEGVRAENEPLVKVTKANNTNVNGTRDVLKNYVESYVSDFDNHPDLLNCQNGVVNLRTGELSPHSPEQRFTYCVPFNFTPGADYSYWVSWLSEATTTPVDWVQTAAGYSITGHTWEEIMFYLYGEPRSGKGTFTETILNLLGQPLSTEADFMTFTAERLGDTQNFDLAQLKPCRFVAAAESKKNQPLNPAKIKQLTGRNMVRCAFKHRDHFTYQPNFKIWLSSNYPVNLDVDDDAAWGRVRVLTFPHSHLGKEDKLLKKRMTSKENLQAVLCWLVEGAIRWYKMWDEGHGLRTPEVITQTINEQRGQQDLMRAWLNEATEDNPASYEFTKKLYTSYAEWCRENGASPKYINQFTQALARKGYKPAVIKVLGKANRVIYGLTLSD